MSTTRHLLNRQRRLAARTAEPDTAENPPEESPPGPRPSARRTPHAPKQVDREDAEQRAQPDPARARRHRNRVLAALVLLTVLLGAFAGWAGARAGELRGTEAVRNSALTDTARTSEVKGKVTEAVNALFSYDHTAPQKNRDAAGHLLTGPAVAQHARLLDGLRKQGEKQKLVLTTTVTDAAVERISSADGRDRARVLVFADQRSTRTGAAGKANSTAAEDGSAYAGAMLAVEAIRTGASWRINRIDTFD
ncbi:hypothetical protein [Streptomyces sulphureus]|uniref:hypothetical protein n=1 Tax=Streptomyces sulphureus TaxID=47758 RepID=UPI0003791566|nr:hypothetical protein [Streptomyces sulphureus]